MSHLWRPKKVWRKKISRPTDKSYNKFNKVVTYMSYWKWKITNEKNIENKVKPNVPLTMQESVREVGLSAQSFIYYINRYPELKSRYDEAKELRREKLRLISEDVLDKALEWDLELSDKDKVDLALKYLKDTDKAYNPKLEVETLNKNLNLEISNDELVEKLLDYLS